MLLTISAIRVVVIAKSRRRDPPTYVLNSSSGCIGIYDSRVRG